MTTGSHSRSSVLRGEESALSYLMKWTVIRESRSANQGQGEGLVGGCDIHLGIRTRLEINGVR